MLKIIYKGILLSPMLLFQSAFQPSRAYIFFNKQKNNQYIYLIAFVFMGACVGMIFAFYLPFQNILERISFAAAAAGAVAVAGLDIYADSDRNAERDAGSYAIKGAIASAFVVPFLFAVSSAGQVQDPFVFAFAFAFAFAGAGAGVLTIVFIFVFERTDPIIFTVAFIVLIAFFGSIGAGLIAFIFAFTGSVVGAGAFKGSISIADGISILEIKNFEIIILPFSFFISYFFVSQLNFIHANNQFIKKKEPKKYYATHDKFSIFQKITILWCPIIAILIYLPVFFNYKPELHIKFTIISTAIPVFDEKFYLASKI